MVLCNEGRHVEARPLVQQMQRLQHADGRSIFEALLIPAIHQSAQDIEETRAALARSIDELLDGPPLAVRDPVREIGITPFYLAYHGLNDRELQARIARLCRKAYRPAWTAPPATHRRGARIRIGFVSSYFNLHSIGIINRGFITRLRRDRFEVIVFSLARHRDALARRIREDSDLYVEFDGSSLARIERTIAEHGLDILFFTDVGMDPLTYFLAYSRLAPLQCVAWGHPDTTGIDTLDYFISADALELPDADSHYTEKLARLPAWITPGYERPSHPAPALSRSEYGLHDHANVYVCTQHPFKIHHEFDEAMGAILRGDPNAEVVLVQGQHAHFTEALKARFRRTIADVSQRIRILPRMPWSKYLGLLAVSDVMIDSFHFSGGNTTYQSLGMGLPVVTLPARFLRGRHSLGCYLRMGMTECVATTPQHYVEIALKLGTNPAYRQSLATRIYQASAVLFDNYETVKALEDFLEEAVSMVR
jgi:predicted O-linked N-acetylglucosamine transferase (SPINDLY family)